MLQFKKFLGVFFNFEIIYYKNNFLIKIEFVAVNAK